MSDLNDRHDPDDPDVIAFDKGSQRSRSRTLANNGAASNLFAWLRRSMRITSTADVVVMKPRAKHKRRTD
jgi:hypothetical protein